MHDISRWYRGVSLVGIGIFGLLFVLVKLRTASELTLLHITQITVNIALLLLGTALMLWQRFPHAVKVLLGLAGLVALGSLGALFLFVFT